LLGKAYTYLRFRFLYTGVLVVVVLRVFSSDDAKLKLDPVRV
jgi:hypothetical protein